MENNMNAKNTVENDVVVQQETEGMGMAGSGEGDVSSENEGVVVTSKTPRLQAVTSDLNRKRVLERMLEQLENPQHGIYQELSTRFLEQTRTLHTAFVAACSSQKAFKLEKRLKRNGVTTSYDRLIRSIRKIWDFVKIEFKDHPQAMHIFVAFGLNREGHRPLTLSRQKAMEQAENLLVVSDELTVLGVEVPVHFNIEGLRSQLDSIKANEKVVYSLHAGRESLSERLDTLREEIGRFLVTVRSHLRGITPQKTPLGRRNLHRGLGFTYSNAEPGEEADVSGEGQSQSNEG